MKISNKDIKVVIGIDDEVLGLDVSYTFADKHLDPNKIYSTDNYPIQNTTYDSLGFPSTGIMIEGESVFICVRFSESKREGITFTASSIKSYNITEEGMKKWITFAKKILKEAINSKGGKKILK